MRLSLLTLLVLSSCNDPGPLPPDPRGNVPTIRTIDDFSAAFDRAGIECDEKLTDPAVPEGIPLETFACIQGDEKVHAMFANTKLERRIIRLGVRSPEPPGLLLHEEDDWVVVFPTSAGVEALRDVIGGSIRRG